MTFRKIIKGIMLVLVGVGLMIGLASPSYADNCGKSDRVPLPKCVIVKGGEAQNLCEQPVTVKVDMPGPDKRATLKTGLKLTWAYGKARNVLCCKKEPGCYQSDECVPDARDYCNKIQDIQGKS